MISLLHLGPSLPLIDALDLLAHLWYPNKHFAHKITPPPLLLIFHVAIFWPLNVSIAIGNGIAKPRDQDMSVFRIILVSANWNFVWTELSGASASAPVSTSLTLFCFPPPAHKNHRPWMMPTRSHWLFQHILNFQWLWEMMFGREAWRRREIVVNHLVIHNNEINISHTPTWIYSAD